MLMNYYNDDTYIDNTLKELNNVRHEGYYVKMAVAWALSLCFVKQRAKTMELFKIMNLMTLLTTKPFRNVVNPSVSAMQIKPCCKI